MDLAGAPTAEETVSRVWAAPDALAHASVGGGDETHPAGEKEGRLPTSSLMMATTRQLGCTRVPRGRTSSRRMDLCQIPRARCRSRV